jgi:ABC-type transport system substrate-binding protein
VRRLGLFLTFAAAAGLVGCNKRPAKEPIRVLRVSMAQKPSSLDPARSGDAVSSAMSALAYEGLFKYHYLKRPYRLEPLLADGLPTWSADRRTLLVKIRRGVLFHDDPCFNEAGGRGREMTAEDVAYSLRRLADPRIASPGWWILQGRIEGLDAWRTRSAQETRKPDYTVPVEGLQVTGRYTLKITLVRPYPRFLHGLASPYAAVVAREAVEKYGEDFGSNPVGTGPFVLDRSASLAGARWIWLRNHAYDHDRYPSEGDREDHAHRLQDADRPLPLVDRLEVELIPDSTKAQARFQTGELDVWSPSSGAPDVGEVKGQTLHRERSLATEVVGLVFNLRKQGVLKNRMLRQAIARALDRERFISLFYSGAAEVQVGPVPPGLEGGESMPRDLGSAELGFDLVAARKLVRKAGYPGGIGLGELEFIVPPEGAYPRMADFIKDSLSLAGIPVKISPLGSWEEFLTAVRKGQGDLWISAWSADFPDAENFLQIHSGTGVTNESGFHDPAYDQFFEQASGLTNGPGRDALNSKMARILVDQVPWAWMLRRYRVWLAQPWVGNLKVHEYEPAPWKYLRVDLGKDGKKE